MVKKKRVPKFTIVTPEIAAWRSTLKVGDKVKMDSIIDSHEPIAEILELFHQDLASGKRLTMHLVSYQDWHKGPVKGLMSEYVLWPIEVELER